MADTSPLILIVDDNAATRYSTGRVLQAAGYDIAAAANGAEGIAKASQLQPAVVILDINLPDIDGFEVCRLLRQRPDTRRMPIMYLSATFVDDTDKIQGVDAGADGYLTHPVEPPVLVGTVKALLRARWAEDAVQASEAKFQAVFDNALNGIALLSDDLVFIDVNRSMCGLLGRERSAIVGRHLSAFSLKERELDLALMTDAIEAHGHWSGTAPVLRSSGEHVELEWRVSRYAVPRVQLAIVSDITDRVLIEKERERLLTSERLARAEAEDANRIKDDFLAALSHELRTPLNAIVGFSRLLLISPPVKEHPELLRQVKAIERNAWVQAQLISDLLDLSRITTGKLDLDRQRFSAAEAIDAALGSLSAVAAKKGVTFRAALERGGDVIFWDSSRFQQVVWNLVDNAIKFSKHGGEVEVGFRRAAHGAELWVVDHGQGISPEFLPRVFDRFRQEDSTSKRGHGGLGLGLTIVSQLVAAHGGTVAAYSAGEGHGARFVVTLPHATAEALDAAAPAAEVVPATIDLHGRRILVVDDNDDARTLLREVLGPTRAEVLDVSSADAALGAMDAFAPDLLISDLSMPLQDGFDLIRALRAGGHSADTLPAIALSAYARDEDRQRAIDSGYQAHFGKPPQISRFLATVAALMIPKQ